MAVIVEMPRYGGTMEEGTIAGWMLSEGESVEKGQVICEIEIEKLTNELEAPVSGVLRKIACPEGESRKCGEPIAVIAAADEDISSVGSGSAEAVPALAAESAAVPASGPAPAPVSGDVKITPKAKKLAEEMGVDYSSVRGTGIHGMITREDIRLAAGSGTAAAAEGMSAPEPEHKPVYASAEGVKMGSVRKVTSRRMMESMHSSAQTSIFMDADITDLVGRYGKARSVYEAEGYKLSYTAIVLKAVSRALAANPVIRTVMTGPDTIATLSEHNIGIAVDADYGLTVPVMKQVDRRDLKSVCRELTVLADKAKAGTLNTDDMSGGTFTISNVGMFGVKYFTPILNTPESAILGVGALTQEAKIVDGGFQARWILTLSLTYDHRIVDGAPAARFLGDLRDAIAGMDL
jgi:pyruvate dehydrogenase E2 component (dihydrolipoamide acetyltransferase)